MKHIFLIVLVIIIVSCNSKKENKNNSNSEITKKKENIPDQINTMYVTAKSGLIYRDEPKGKRLGKIKFNTEVKIIDRTKDIQTIKSNGETLTGTWVGIEYNNKKVYVFDGFLETRVTETLDMDFYTVHKKLKNYVWVSKNYKELLTKHNLYSEAKNYNKSPHSILFHNENKLTTWSEYTTEDKTSILETDFSFKLNKKFKITKLTDTALTINVEGNNYDYFKIPISSFNSDITFVLLTQAIEKTNKKWFKGKYIFKLGNATEEFNFTEHSKIRFISWYAKSKSKTFVDVIKINNTMYEILSYNNNIYSIQEIKPFEQGTEPKAIHVGEPITLKRISK